jgi:hypothetical protein
MKKTLTGMLTLLAGAYAVHAQGTVSLANYLVLSPYIYVSYKAPDGSLTPLGGTGSGPTPTTGNYATSGVLGNGNDWTVQLYGAPGANDTAASLVPLYQALTGSGATQPASSLFETSGFAGAWNSGTVGVVVGALGNGSAATVQLYAWYSGGSLDLTLAYDQANGLPWGASTVQNVTTGGPPVPGLTTTPGTAADLPAFGNFTVQGVPEPSTIALGVIGASTFLMRLRRKH